MRPEGQALRRSVLIVVVLAVVLPIVAGAGQTLRTAFGLHEGLGGGLSLAPWSQLFALPGMATSLRLSLITGVGSTLLALILALGLCVALQTSGRAGWGARALAPVLAVPHAAVAIGFGFLIAPAGWISRLLAAALGWQDPPLVATVQDAAGLALLLGLVVKELPFLLLVMLAAARQVPVATSLALGRSLGYSAAAVWLRLILPQLWPLIRLPVLVVQAYALSCVDMAIILGPSNPPTLAVAVTRWFGDPDLAMVYPASAGAVLSAALVAAVLLGWGLAERGVARAGLIWLRRGGRGRAEAGVLRLASGLGVAVLGLGIAALVVLILWSFAFRWSFPDPLPESWSLRLWANPQGGWGRAAGYTLGLGLAVTALCLTLAVAWLEAEDRSRAPRAAWATALIYLPLLLPQIGFLYGLNLLFLRMGLTGGVAAVIWAQALFVFPYVMIALSEPWRGLDPALIRTAASLGAGANRRLFSVKLPTLLGPILVAAAIGFAVSVAQYLPTLFMGAGRIATLATEAVTLASGSDRRVVGTYAVLQAALPFAAYVLALAVPRVLYRNRRALRGGM
ncbi:ABC transporter permease [Cypionkella sp.]|uniref:ABC transporter permease n=1 Tax=Cypionkella sp. TaxID=2811411 RepID=UPI002761D2A2|nr:ABC transporter permease [Cypionkella sp.]